MSSETEKVFTFDQEEYYLDRIFLEYEQPELFSVFNKVGNKFIVMLVADNKWLMTQISKDRLLAMEDGSITIREIFTKSQKQQIQLIERFEDGFAVSILVPGEISEDYLPAEGAKLSWSNKDFVKAFGGLENENRTIPL